MRTFFTNTVVRRAIGLLVVALVGAGGAFGGNAAANHTSSDVPNGSFFHESVGWLIQNGIAQGFNDGTFRTGDNITRGQASFWFGNYNSSFEVVTQDATQAGSDTFKIVAAQCPAGKRAVAGGGSANAVDLMLTESWPATQTEWRVGWETVDNSPIPNGVQFSVYALCMPFPPAVG